METIKKNILIVTILAVLIFAAIYNWDATGPNWEVYSSQQNCRPEQPVKQHQGKTAWVCDDGKTYWQKAN